MGKTRRGQQGKSDPPYQTSFRNEFFCECEFDKKVSYSIRSDISRFTARMWVLNSSLGMLIAVEECVLANEFFLGNNTSILLLDFF